MTEAIQQAAEHALKRIREYDYVTFVEIETICKEAGITTRGTLALTSPDDRNLVLWADMSEDFIAVVEAIRPHTDLAPASFLTYLVDGGLLKLPLAKKPPKGGYKKEHWAPVCLRPKERKKTI